ncbi:MAG: prepilin-type N-terminal cleavage/methylation domain-containing protein [Candidatus Omnitrophica bacterium]|nr:prepilin-type N-terminal cleavage/methylation domain-containing protein [Candidatus Omnitrophota bacterium]MBU1767756.1 prepilin-type N-terminal cleavage/methylation domain-containing protein [Candidatus Omnitrophota bacterium]
MRSNGFSFIELMTVVAIMAVLVAASMPMFRNYTRGKNLKEGTNMVVSALRRTRNSAITDRKNYRVVFDTDNNTIAIDADTTDEDFATINDGLAENWKGLSEFVEFDTWVIKAGNSYAPGNPEIYFLEFKTTGGLSTGISDQTIVLIETSTQDTKAIRVNALTGKIGVLE